MYWQQVLGSSNVAAIAYDEEKKECYVRFNSGAVYVYEGVGPGIWEELQHSQSKGRFIGIQFRRTHTYRRILDVAPDSGGGVATEGAEG